MGAPLVGEARRAPGGGSTNAAHGIGERRYITNRDRSRGLDTGEFAWMTAAHVRMSLRLQAAFGLRREEAIESTPAYADRGALVRIKAFWTKGAGGRNWAAQRTVYERQIRLIVAFPGGKIP